MSGGGNPYHDPKTGEFTSGPGGSDGGGGSASKSTFKPALNKALGMKQSASNKIPPQGDQWIRSIEKDRAAINARYAKHPILARADFFLGTHMSGGGKKGK